MQVPPCSGNFLRIWSAVLRPFLCCLVSYWFRTSLNKEDSLEGRALLGGIPAGGISICLTVMRRVGHGGEYKVYKSKAEKNDFGSTYATGVVDCRRQVGLGCSDATRVVALNVEGCRVFCKENLGRTESDEG